MSTGPTPPPTIQFPSLPNTGLKGNDCLWHIITAVIPHHTTPQNTATTPHHTTTLAPQNIASFTTPHTKSNYTIAYTTTTTTTTSSRSNLTNLPSDCLIVYLHNCFIHSLINSSIRLIVLLIDISECTEKTPQCPYWAASGECERNPVYMLSNCCKSCEGHVQSEGDKAARKVMSVRARQFVPYLSITNDYRLFKTFSTSKRYASEVEMAVTQNYDETENHGNN